MLFAKEQAAARVLGTGRPFGKAGRVQQQAILAVVYNTALDLYPAQPPSPLAVLKLDRFRMLCRNYARLPGQLLMHACGNSREIEQPETVPPKMRKAVGYIAAF